MGLLLHFLPGLKKTFRLNNMKQLVAAPKPDFASYIDRPDTRYIERQSGDSLEELYKNGYLPYSSSKDVHNVFYSARSARVALQQFKVTSENRRIAKKFDGQFDKRRIDTRSFVADDAFFTFVLAYFTKRHGANVMPRERLELLLASNLITTVVEYRKDSIIMGYVLEVESGAMRHYWYSAYDVSFTQQSLGLWLMLDCIEDAVAAGIAYYYLGTVYGQKALYKTNFDSLEWWNGTEWSTDIAKLKEKARSD